MNFLQTAGIVVGALVAITGLDIAANRILRSKPPKNSIQHLRKLADDLEPKEFKKRRK